jgi:hypothetical protein
MDRGTAQDYRDTFQADSGHSRTMNFTAGQSNFTGLENQDRLGCQRWLHITDNLVPKLYSCSHFG